MGITNGLNEAIRRSGTRPAVILGEQQPTWEDIGARVARLAGGFRHLGAAPGERVALLLLNGQPCLECFFAVPWAGAVLVPLNHRLGHEDLLHILADSEPCLLVVDDQWRAVLPELAQGHPPTLQLVHTGSSEPPPGAHSYEALIAESPALPDAGCGGDTLAALFYTGGTTGTPKGAMLSHDNLLANMEVVVSQSLDAKTRYLHASAMFHVSVTSAIYGVTAVGGAHAFLPRFDAAAVLEAVRNLGITVTVLVPTTLYMLLAVPGDWQAPGSLRQIRYGASPMPPELLRRAIARFPGVRFIQGYGLTETSPIITTLDHAALPLDAPQHASAGRPVPHAQVRVVDRDGAALPPGAVGEIVTRGPHVMQGYWRQPELTAEVIRDGWLHTGDLGYLDETGYLFIVDRLKDVIITGGENVYSVEVENVLYRHPAVGLCAVIGIPHDQWGESVHAVVVPREGQTLTRRDVLRHCRSHLSHYKCPRTVEIRGEPLPLSGANKVLKRELRAPFWAGQPRQVH